MKSAFKSLVVSILIAEASWLLKRHKPTIIAITGSVGKTTTKDAVYAAIKNSISARKSEKSFNSEIGVPLTVLGLKNGWNNPFLWIKNIFDGFFIALFSKDYPAVLVLEAGIDRPGDMERLTRWLTPDVVVLTALPLVPVHVEYFATPGEVADEKMRLVSALKPDGTFIFNNDDMIIQERVKGVLQRSLGYGRYLPTDYTGSHEDVIYRDDRPHGYQFDITHAGESATIRVMGSVGLPHIYSSAAAIAVADTLGISLGAAVNGLLELRTPNGRMRLVEGIKSTTILDDTYNASPAAVEQALETLATMKYAKRKIAVLGDMLELGRFSSEEHEKIGSVAATCADVLITVGVRARKIAEGALNHGMDEANILQYEDAISAGRELQNYIAAGDVVLVKASQGIRAERVVEELMAHPDDAYDLLVRQDEEWLKR
jgi:UDP-N-acetylmuramoyl-tripeptide--D-alanyl-D-alanine ligase